jgi:hypothetical protein
MAEMKLKPPERCDLRAEWEAKLERGDYRLHAQQGVDDQRAEVMMCWSGEKAGGMIDAQKGTREMERKHSGRFSISIEDLRAWCVEVLRLTGGVP